MPCGCGAESRVREVHKRGAARERSYHSQPGMRGTRLQRIWTIDDDGSRWKDAACTGGLIDWMAGRFFKGKNTSSRQTLARNARKRKVQYLTRSDPKGCGCGYEWGEMPSHG